MYHMVTRPASIILRDRKAIVECATRVATQKRMKNDSSRNSKSPRTVYTYQTTDSSDPNLSARSSSKTSLTEPIGYDTPPDELPSTELFDASSIFSREKSPSKLGDKDTSDDPPKEAVLGLSGEFTDSSTLLQGLGVPK